MSNFSNDGYYWCVWRLYVAPMNYRCSNFTTYPFWW